MFALFRELMEERVSYIRNLEAKPAETAKSMNVSKKFLQALHLSFEIIACQRVDDENEKLTKKKIKIKPLEDRLDALYRNVIDVSTDSKFDDIVALATAYYNVGLVQSFDSSTLSTGIKYFTRCLELLEGKHLDPRAILTSICALNELNLFCVKLHENNYTFKFLNTALELYLKYTMEDNFPDPVDMVAIVDIKEKESNPRILLDSFHHTTLQDLGVQYIAKPKDKHVFVMYVHQILSARLSDMILGGRKFEDKCLDWALTLFQLSKYFIMNNRFNEARNHIATGDYVLNRHYEDTLKMITKENNSKRRHLFARYDYVCGVRSRSWGSYGVSLLRFGMEKFVRNKEKDACELDISKLEIKSDEESKLLIFSNLEKELKSITNQITYTCIVNLDDAKTLFVQTLRHLDAAKDFFSAGSDIESHAQIVHEISQMYKYLAGFQYQREQQIKLHKRRLEWLENVSKIFHTTIEGDTELRIYKQIWFEIVTTCSTLMDLIAEEACDNDILPGTTEEIQRFAQLISENIDLYINV